VTPPADFEAIYRASELLAQGGVVAFPTETVYGLGADAFNPVAINRVYELKGRPRHNPLIVHVSGPEMARRVARVWSERADVLARKFWPGPLSLLVPRAASLPEVVTAGSDLVAVRCPNHPVTLALLFGCGRPLVGPSANLSGQVSPTTAEHVREAFSAEDVFVLDGGPCEAGIESTVLDVTRDPPRILRPGVISGEQIGAVLGCEVLRPELGVRSRASSEPLHSPGLLERHYAPRTPAHLFDPTDWPAVLGKLGPAVVITHRLRHVEPPHQLIEMPPDAADYAAALYAAIREADRHAAGVILIERPPGDSELWQAITDRLARATTPLSDDD
jgi:L-threonylcarbamoyladenylate synthase